MPENVKVYFDSGAVNRKIEEVEKVYDFQMRQMLMFQMMTEEANWAEKYKALSNQCEKLMDMETFMRH